MCFRGNLKVLLMVDEEKVESGLSCRDGIQEIRCKYISFLESFFTIVRLIFECEIKKFREIILLSLESSGSIFLLVLRS